LDLTVVVTFYHTCRQVVATSCQLTLRENIHPELSWPAVICHLTDPESEVEIFFRTFRVTISRQVSQMAVVTF